MEKKNIGSYRNMLIHPGETLKEILDEKDISQKELAIRCGVSPKHVSTIVNGTKDISVSFAKKLSYALQGDAQYWINLQAIYDKDLFDYEDILQITVSEKNVLKPLLDIVAYLERKGYIKGHSIPADTVVSLRETMCVSNLCNIPKLSYNGAYRASVNESTNVNVYVLYAWQRICEMETEQINLTQAFNREKLKESLPQIKQAMFLSQSEIPSYLQSVFAKCGIAFAVVKHFKGAPVQGMIKKTKDERVMLCVTLRQVYADIFWFSLFHEIGHLLHGDEQKRFIDFESVEDEQEKQADRFAQTILLEPQAYESFLKLRDYTKAAIKAFAETQNVKPYIVIGRMQKDGILNWHEYLSEKERYEWLKELSE